MRSHYAVLLQVKDSKARDWYGKEAAEQTWSVRTLQRNISSQYYYCMLKTQRQDLVFYNYILKCFSLIDLKTEKELREEIETQKTMFYLQQQECKEQKME